MLEPVADPLQQIAMTRNLNHINTITVALAGIASEIPCRLRTKAEWRRIDMYIDQITDAVIMAATETHQFGVDNEA